MSEKPSSRKRHRWSLEPGDLVKVGYPMPEPTGFTGFRKVVEEQSLPAYGVILVTFSANVYEGSSAEILVNSEKVILDTKYLIRIDLDPDISSIS